MRKNIILRCLLLIVSTLLISIACSFFNISGYGGDPLFIFNLSLSSKLNIKIGDAMTITNIVLGLFFVILNWKKIGLGTICGIFLVGPLTDLLTKYVFNFPLENEFIRVLIFYIGIIALALGIISFIKANLGLGPTEGIATEMSKRTGLSVGKIRIIMDISLFISAMLLGGYKILLENGILSVICILGATFLTGVFIDIINNLFKKFNKLTEKK